MTDLRQQALDYHACPTPGKIAIQLTKPAETAQDLTLAYSPGVAEPVREIAANPDEAYRYTAKANLVAVITNGTAILGLGNLGPLASKPVMEGKALLFKRFANIDAIDIEVTHTDTEDFIRTVANIADTFGGINLEDISAPRCVEIERTLIEELDIPVFHDDQHGTAIVVTAGIMNALKLIGKKKEEVTLVVSGTGAAGSSVIKMLYAYGIRSIYAFNVNGILRKGDMGEYNFLEKELCEITNEADEALTLSEAMKRADLFVGVSAPKVLTKEMVASMKKDAIVFAMANPEPEISYEDAVDAGARVVGTGRSDFPNQVNNVLAFPGLFKGALQVRASKITEAMKMAAAEGIASLIEEKDLREDYVIPGAFDERVAEVVADAVARKAVEEGLSGI